VTNQVFFPYLTSFFLVGFLVVLTAKQFEVGMISFSGPVSRIIARICHRVGLCGCFRTASSRRFFLPSFGSWALRRTWFLRSRLCALFLIGPMVVCASAQKSRQIPPVRVKGSFVIAAICRDGIIVASDSRGMLKDRRGRRIGYYDTNQKIYPMRDNLIADTGYASLNDPNISFLSALMSRFAKSDSSRVEVDRLPDSYFKYSSGVLSNAGADSAKVQTLFFAGFKAKKPEICVYQGQSTHAVRCTFQGYLSSPGQHIEELRSLKSMSFAQAAAVMRKTIEDYAAAVRPGLVGGPVVIRTLTPSGSQWFGSHPDWPQWDSFSDLEKDYGSGRVPFELMPGVTKADLDSLIVEGAAWARFGQAQDQGSVSSAGLGMDSLNTVR
jgi:20S proteasome alpha/beta subunit